MHNPDEDRYFVRLKVEDILFNIYGPTRLLAKKNAEMFVRDHVPAATLRSGRKLKNAVPRNDVGIYVTIKHKFISKRIAARRLVTCHACTSTNVVCVGISGGPDEGWLIRWLCPEHFRALRRLFLHAL